MAGFTDDVMLAFDIETLGFKKKRDLITVIALYQPSYSVVLRFVELDPDGEIRYTGNCKEKVGVLIAALDSANSLCAFNGMAFDIPFIATQFKIPHSKVQEWMSKTFDVLHICRRDYNRTFSLNLILEMNIPGASKTGTGDHATQLARLGGFIELEEYCLEDSKLIHELSTMQSIKIPECRDWRTNNGGEAYDPTNVLKMDASAFPLIVTSYGVDPSPSSSQQSSTSASSTPRSSVSAASSPDNDASDPDNDASDPEAR
jgi:hypothetical protein